jgi:hypothetical protein
MMFLDTDIKDDFDPKGQITRGELAAAIGAMFFATDDSDTSEFTDVDPDDPAYSYIAAGRLNSVLQGFSSGDFHGERPATKEELYTFTGRTLIYRSGGAYPEDLETYLDFTDAWRLSGFSRADTALLIKEKILTVPKNGRLWPQDKTTRLEAALILYRLYCRLYGYE